MVSKKKMNPYEGEFKKVLVLIVNKSHLTLEGLE